MINQPLSDHLLRLWYVAASKYGASCVFQTLPCVLSYTSLTFHWFAADIGAIAKFTPHSATTNFSFILAAIQKPESKQLLDVSVQYGKTRETTVNEQVDAALDRLLVEFGKKILEIVPGTISTAVEAKFAFDTAGTIRKALSLIGVSAPCRIFASHMAIQLLCPSMLRTSALQIPRC